MAPSLRDIAGYCWIGLVCVALLLQMLGAPICFWELDPTDDFVSTLLMGLAVLTSESYNLPFHSCLLLAVISTVAYYFLKEFLLFRPPVFA
jgi:hypothetical protein